MPHVLVCNLSLKLGKAFHKTRGYNECYINGVTLIINVITVASAPIRKKNSNKEREKKEGTNGYR